LPALTAPAIALLESEVAKRGGTYTFCDTDSLAVNCGDQCPDGIPCLPAADIEATVAQFDALNSYDREIVPHLLKVEHTEYPDLRCFAVSAKRYVLYRWWPGNRIQIIKASESALGAIIGRSRNESTPKLAERIWLSILMRHLNVNQGQRHRAKPLIDFDVPLRRKFPISQPAILKRLEVYNKRRSYDFRVKPFGFVQTIAPDRQTGEQDLLPIAPFETDVRKSMKLQWVDFNTGDSIRLDWHRTGMAGTIGLLGRLRVRSKKLARIGKEVDRLDEDEGAALEPEQPIEYEREDLAEDIAHLASFPQVPRLAISASQSADGARWRSDRLSHAASRWFVSRRLPSGRAGRKLPVSKRAAQDGIQVKQTKKASTKTRLKARKTNMDSSASFNVAAKHLFRHLHDARALRKNPLVQRFFEESDAARLMRPQKSRSRQSMIFFRSPNARARNMNVKSVAQGLRRARQAEHLSRADPRYFRVAS
jgi:hypothetical protein